MLRVLIILFIGLVSLKSNGQDKLQPEINVVYGDKHIFTIETPLDWINDKELAQKNGLVCFFYPTSEINQSKKNYFYANGIDKESKMENLEDFIKGDLKKFKEKYPDLTYEKIPVEFDGGLRNVVLCSFSNLTDRFNEQVLYCETDDSFIVFSFAAMKKVDYGKYQPVFDEFISSFNYRGNNPQPFLDYMNNKE